MAFERLQKGLDRILIPRGAHRITMTHPRFVALQHLSVSYSDVRAGAVWWRNDASAGRRRAWFITSMDTLTFWGKVDDIAQALDFPSSAPEFPGRLKRRYQRAKTRQRREELAALGKNNAREW